MRELYKISGKYRGVETEMHFDCNPSVIHRILLGTTYKLILKSARTIVDVGANAGAFTKFMSLNYPEAMIYAFEPDPDTFQILKLNTSNNNKIHSVNAGLFNESHKAKFYRHAGNSTSNSFVNKSDDFIIVDIVAAQEAMHRLGIVDIDILKIDAESCDYQILKAILDAGLEPKLIYIEYHSDVDRQSIITLLDDGFEMIHSISHPDNQGEFTYVSKKLPAASFDRV